MVAYRFNDDDDDDDDDNNNADGVLVITDPVDFVGLNLDELDGRVVIIDTNPTLEPFVEDTEPFVEDTVRDEEFGPEHSRWKIFLFFLLLGFLLGRLPVWLPTTTPELAPIYRGPMVTTTLTTSSSSPPPFVKQDMDTAQPTSSASLSPLHEDRQVPVPAKVEGYVEGNVETNGETIVVDPSDSDGDSNVPPDHLLTYSFNDDDDDDIVYDPSRVKSNVDVEGNVDRNVEGNVEGNVKTNDETNGETNDETIIIDPSDSDSDSDVLPDPLLEAKNKLFLFWLLFVTRLVCCLSTTFQQVTVVSGAATGVIADVGRRIVSFITDVLGSVAFGSIAVGGRRIIGFVADAVGAVATGIVAVGRSRLVRRLVFWAWFFCAWLGSFMVLLFTNYAPTTTTTSTVTTFGPVPPATQVMVIVETLVTQDPAFRPDQSKAVAIYQRERRTSALPTLKDDVDVGERDDTAKAVEAYRPEGKDLALLSSHCRFNLLCSHRQSGLISLILQDVGNIADHSKAVVVYRHQRLIFRDVPTMDPNARVTVLSNTTTTTSSSSDHSDSSSHQWEKVTPTETIWILYDQEFEEYNNQAITTPEYLSSETTSGLSRSSSATGTNPVEPDTKSSVRADDVIDDFMVSSAISPTLLSTEVDIDRLPSSEVSMYASSLSSSSESSISPANADSTITDTVETAIVTSLVSSFGDSPSEITSSQPGPPTGIVTLESVVDVLGVAENGGNPFIRKVKPVENLITVAAPTTTIGLQSSRSSSGLVPVGFPTTDSTNPAATSSETTRGLSRPSSATGTGGRHSRTISAATRGRTSSFDRQRSLGTLSISQQLSSLLSSEESSPTDDVPDSVDRAIQAKYSRPPGSSTNEVAPKPAIKTLSTLTQSLPLSLSIAEILALLVLILILILIAILGFPEKFRLKMKVQPPRPQSPSPVPPPAPTPAAAAAPSAPGTVTQTPRFQQSQPLNVVLPTPPVTLPTTAPTALSSALSPAAAAATITPADPEAGAGTGGGTDTTSGANQQQPPYVVVQGSWKCKYCWKNHYTELGVKYKGIVSRQESIDSFDEALKSVSKSLYPTSPEHPSQQLKDDIFFEHENEKYLNLHMPGLIWEAFQEWVPTARSEPNWHRKINVDRGGEIVKEARAIIDGAVEAGHLSAGIEYPILLQKKGFDEKTVYNPAFQQYTEDRNITDEGEVKKLKEAMKKTRNHFFGDILRRSWGAPEQRTAAMVEAMKADKSWENTNKKS